jgi:hypothetical protein
MDLGRLVGVQGAFSSGRFEDTLLLLQFYNSVDENKCKKLNTHNL